MTDPRRPAFRATRTTPDPYPPHPVLVFTDKPLAAARRASCLSVKDRDGNMENAFGSELSDWLDLSVPRFLATLNPSGEECIVWTDLLLAELELLDPTTCVEIGHRSGEGPRQMVPFGQLDGLIEGEVIFPPVPDAAEVAVAVPSTVPRGYATYPGGHGEPGPSLLGERRNGDIARGA